MIIGKLIKFFKSSKTKTKSGRRKQNKQRRVYTTGVYFDTSGIISTDPNSRIPAIITDVSTKQHHRDVLKQESMTTISTEATTTSHHQNIDDVPTMISNVRHDDAWVPSYLENHNDDVPILVRPKPGMLSPGCYYDELLRKTTDDESGPSVIATPAASAACERDADNHNLTSNFHTKRLEAFYRVHNPANMTAVETTLKTFKGREDVMFDRLKKKYGVENPTKPWLVEFYTECNPKKLDHVEMILDKYAGREEVLYSKLMKQYNIIAGDKETEKEEPASEPRSLARQESKQLIMETDDEATIKEEHSSSAPTSSSSKRNNKRMNEHEDRKLLQKVIVNSWTHLPEDSDNYSSNYIMINTRRFHQLIPTLRRERYLETIAKEHAHRMASEQKVFQIATPYDVHHKLRSLEEQDDTNGGMTYDRTNNSFTRIGSNVGKGKSIAEIHKHMTVTLAEKNNLQDKRFFKIGMATAHDTNGILYLCQIFGG